MPTLTALRRFRPLCAIMLAIVAMPAAFGNAPQAKAATGDVGSLGVLPPADEMVTVLEEPHAETEVDRARMIEDTHLANERGRQLYLQHRYGEAVPYLRAAAKRGHKMAQARLGEILVLGLDDIDQNVEVGMGWLGVAAYGTTLPSIRSRFGKLRSQVPVELHPQLATVVSDYIDKYGPDATGVNCWRHKPAGTQITRMRCGFEDERRYVPYWDDERRYIPEWHPGFSGAGPTPISMITNLYYDGPMDGSN